MNGDNDKQVTEQLEFRDPPQDKRGDPIAFWSEVWKMLRARPGEWAQLPGHHANAVASNIKRGLFSGITEGEFEATTRSIHVNGKKRAIVWARYVGQQVAPSELDDPAARRHREEAQQRGPQVGDTGRPVK